MKNLIAFKLFENTTFDWETFYDEYKESDDWHQGILNYGYNEWQKETNNWNYSDMLDWVEETVGKEARLLIQLGKYNQQVGNGGHLQYHENRYDGSDGGADDDTPLHQQMLDLMQEFNYDKSDIGKKIYDLAKGFQVIPQMEDCQECDGDGVIEEWEDDDEEYDEEYESKKNEGYVGTFSCGHCGGSGEDPSNYTLLVQPENIDDKYYDIDDQWMQELAIKAKDYVLKNMLSQNIKLDDSDIKNIRSFF